MSQMNDNGSDQESRVRAAFAETLNSDDIDMVTGPTGRMPSGEEVRLFHAAVRGEPNRGASLVVDASGAVHPRQRMEALAGREVFVPRAAAAEGPEPRERAADPVKVEPATNDLTLPECVTQRETITVTVPKSSVRPKADVYLLADTTGSMGSILDAVKAGIDLVLNAPELAPFDVFWGVGNYKDFPVPPNPFAFEPQLAPTSDKVAVHDAVFAWTASDGFDTPEGQLFALQQVAADPAIGWRAESKRILVWFGDAPGHDPVCSAISGVADITEQTVTQALVDAGITVLAISTETFTAGSLDADPTAGSTDYGVCTVGGTAGQATRIAAATPGGSHTTGVDAGSMIATLVSLISAAVHTIKNVHLEPTGEITGFVGSIDPAGGYGPLPGDVEHVLTFEVTWTGSVTCADKDQVFTGSLDVVADGEVVGGKKVRITVPACRWHHSVEMICGSQRPGRGHDGDDHGDDHGDDRERCETVVDGRYATAVTIYNPTTCTVTLVKYFAPLILHGDPVGREPRTIPARPFAKLELRPGEATLEDCCTLAEAVGPTGGPLVLGVLDVVADHALEVTVTHTAAGPGQFVSSIDSRTIVPRRA
jgi:Integrin beta chain VWA domain